MIQHFSFLIEEIILFLRNRKFPRRNQWHIGIYSSTNQKANNRIDWQKKIMYNLLYTNFYPNSIYESWGSSIFLLHTYYKATWIILNYIFLLVFCYQHWLSTYFPNCYILNRNLMTWDRLHILEIETRSIHNYYL